jgi:ABC-type Na+ transport system ATPase subunit NatA
MIQTKQLTLKKKIPEISQLDLMVEEGETYVLLSSGTEAIHHLINIFQGLEKDYTGTVEIDHLDIRPHWKYCAGRMVYLSNGSQWPQDLKTSSLVSYFRENIDISEDDLEELLITLNLEEKRHKRLSELEEVEWRNILFSLARLKKSKNYIIWDFVRGMPLDFVLEFKKRVHQLKRKGCSILYLSDDVFFASEIGERIGFLKKGKLLLELKASNMKRMRLKELYYQFLAEK